MERGAALAGIVQTIGSRLAGRGLPWDEAKQVAVDELLVTPDALKRATAQFGESGSAWLYEQSIQDSGEVPFIDEDVTEIHDMMCNREKTETGQTGITVHQLLLQLAAMVLRDKDVGSMRVCVYGSG